MIMKNLPKNAGTRDAKKHSAAATADADDGLSLLLLNNILMIVDRANVRDLQGGKKHRIQTMLFVCFTHMVNTPKLYPTLRVDVMP